MLHGELVLNSNMLGNAVHTLQQGILALKETDRSVARKGWVGEKLMFSSCNTKSRQETTEPIDVCWLYFWCFLIGKIMTNHNALTASNKNSLRPAELEGTL